MMKLEVFLRAKFCLTDTAYRMDTYAYTWIYIYIYIYGGPTGRPRHKTGGGPMGKGRRVPPPRVPTASFGPEPGSWANTYPHVSMCVLLYAHVSMCVCVADCIRVCLFERNTHHFVSIY